MNQLKIIAIILLVAGFIIILRYWDFPNDNQIKRWLMTNKQKRNRALIFGFGFILLGTYLIIKEVFF